VPVTVLVPELMARVPLLVMLPAKVFVPVAVSPAPVMLPLVSEAPANSTLLNVPPDPAILPEIVPPLTVPVTVPPLIVPPAFASVPVTVSAPLPEPSVPLFVPPIQLMDPPVPANKVPVLVTAVVAPNEFAVPVVVKVPARAPPFTTALPNVTELAPVEEMVPLFVTAPSSVPFWTFDEESMTNEPPAMFEIVPPVLISVAPLLSDSVPVLPITIADALLKVPPVRPVTVMVPRLEIALPAPVPMLELDVVLLIVKVIPAATLNPVYSLPIIVSESSVTPLVLFAPPPSVGESFEPTPLAGKMTSAFCRAVAIPPGLHVTPTQVQLADVPQAVLPPVPFHVMVDALNCRFHTSNIIAATRNAIPGQRFL